VFRHNRAYHGGAIYALGSFSNCTFEANQSLNLAGAGGDSKGGAVHGQANGENPQINVTVPEATNGLFFADCKFLNNSVSYRSASAVWCKYGTCESSAVRDFTWQRFVRQHGAAAGAAAIVALKKVDTISWTAVSSGELHARATDRP
jgi:predicted outer membrane repeat protein